MKTDEKDNLLHLRKQLKGMVFWGGSPHMADSRWRLLEKQGAPVVKQGLPGEDPEDEKSRERVLVCRQCGRHITDENSRVAINGKHRHTFANPHGHVYGIGCFASALGCLGVGPSSNEFAWFKGYSWQIVVCADCMTHLGWFFLSSGEHHFFGLIVERIVSSF